MIQTVVTDLDGTIVRADGTVSDATAAMAQTLRAQGIPLIAATARTPAGLRDLHPLDTWMTFAVCSSGAIGYDPRDGSFAWRHRLSRDTMAQVLTWVGRLPDLELSAYDGMQWYLTHGHTNARGWTPRGPKVFTARADLLEVEACAMAICHPELDSAALIAELGPAGLAGPVALHRAGIRAVDITAAGINKATGVTQALEMLGVRADRAIAFGDMPVDIPMFTAVGHSVAMGNAAADVKAAATTTTGSVEDDGFARYLRSILLHANS